ncbi:N-acetylgalactosaminyltransferase 6 [Musca domestica]|uniref:Polypeptide N-acetylgalactosaminyltransferase n=1 Tax=Musca domestica TaxID=7370 RepID=A0A1I8N5X2_MUSDO|nr:N-acetylgalactosaminyltransferase 6 [Musca domestica]XP_011295182.1 N-acetylgalactosaminyltransferase 6 [Musca domestica]XP_019894657.1 N-acetylgalactosaminyltransferase 6 [Musca domestica]
MRRPNVKWLFKTACLLIIAGTLFILLTGYLSASPYTNKPTFIQKPIVAAHVAQKPPSQHDRHQPLADVVEQPVGPAPEENRPPKVAPVEQPKIKSDENNVDNDAVNNELLEEERQQPQLLPPSHTKRDWHDYTAMERDSKRVGFGEQGKRAYNNDESTKDLERKMSLENGFNAYLSDMISVNRSVPDIRNKGCRNKLYDGELLTVSVVIPYYNEHFSVLVRSIHSLVNRSPPELLKEIILVDDFSDREYLFKQLDQYVAENFPNLVQIIRLKKRTGLIGARMAGARKATADVLIFLDSHIEANYNWLPPLLEPIKFNKRTAVCPFIDVIDHSNFEYRAQDEGARGAFDWEFYYKRLPLLPEDLVDRTKPFKSPVMAGGLFAISREFFFELGGYDEGLDIWGGEQYELSFKIWMCGGEMYDAPCSRIAHIYRGPRNSMPSPRKGDYVHRNYKRVAEVWMDEYKQYLYEHGQGIYENIDAGDLTEQKAIREKLHCKSFKWFMENVAFDLTKVYPPVEPADYAYGAIQNVGTPTLCVDTLGKPRHSDIGLYPCHEDLKRPQRNQNWALSWHRDLRLRRKLDCLDVQQTHKNAPVWLWDCHGQGGNQFWSYDREHKWLVHGRNHGSNKRCLEASPKDRKLYVNICDEDNLYMQWNFGVVNNTALDSFWEDIPSSL